MKENLEKKDNNKNPMLIDILHEGMIESSMSFIEKLRKRGDVQLGVYTKTGVKTFRLHGTDEELPIETICNMFLQYVDAGLDCFERTDVCNCKTCEDKETILDTL